MQRSFLGAAFRTHIVIPSRRFASGRHALDEDKLAISTFLGAKVSKEGDERERGEILLSLADVLPARAAVYYRRQCGKETKFKKRIR